MAFKDGFSGGGEVEYPGMSKNHKKAKRSQEQLDHKECGLICILHSNS